MQRNADAAERSMSRHMELDLATLLLHHRYIVRRGGNAEDEGEDLEGVQCPNQ
jgi:hypothetical protein